MEWWQILLYFVVLALGWLMSYFVRPWVQEKLAIRTALIADYLIPFKIWCRALYKQLVEFKATYTSQQVYPRLSRTLIIIDYRELHDVLRETGKYIGKIQNEKPQIASYLMELVYLVDNLWHGLQDDFSVNFDQSEHDTWIAAIIEYPEKERLVQAISTRSNPILKYFKREKKFKNLTNYLLKQIPK